MAAIQITKEKLLLVEGADEVSVFNTLLEKHEISDVQVFDCGGNMQLKNKFPAILKSPGFENVKSYAIIQDADSNSQSTLQRVQHLLKSHGQPVPTVAEEFVEKDGLRVGIYILPGAGASGMLEDLYLNTLEGSDLLHCIDKCVDELKTKYPPTAEKGKFSVSNNLSKVRAHGTLMATSGPHNRLGNATKDGYWGLSHATMLPLTQFIHEL